MHSLRGVVETGLPECLPEKKGEKGWPLPAESHFLQSGLRGEFGELRGFLAIFGEMRPSSLHARLRGGARGIRTLSTDSDASKRPCAHEFHEVLRQNVSAGEFGEERP